MHFNNYNDDRAKNHRIYAAEILWRFYENAGYPQSPLTLDETYPRAEMVEWLPVIVSRNCLAGLYTWRDDEHFHADPQGTAFENNPGIWISTTFADVGAHPKDIDGTIDGTSNRDNYDGHTLPGVGCLAWKVHLRGLASCRFGLPVLDSPGAAGRTPKPSFLRRSCSYNPDRDDGILHWRRVGPGTPLQG